MAATVPAICHVFKPGLGKVITLRGKTRKVASITIQSGTTPFHIFGTAAAMTTRVT